MVNKIIMIAITLINAKYNFHLTLHTAEIVSHVRLQMFVIL